MDIIDTTVKPFIQSLYGKTADMRHVSRVVRRPSIVRDASGVHAIYGHWDWSHSQDADLIRLLRDVEFPQAMRLATQQGVKFDTKRTREIYFGYTAARPVFCVAPGQTAATKNHPDIHRHVERVASRLEELFRLHSPETFDRQCELTTGLGSGWRIAGTTWSQCVINDRNAFGYHLDRNNIPGTWNAMVTFSSGVRGGHTVVPCMDAAFEMSGARWLIFEAQTMHHGVTPIVEPSGGGMRYSMVFYGHKLTMGLGTIEQEQARFHEVIDQRFDPAIQSTRDHRTVARRKRSDVY